MLRYTGFIGYGTVGKACHKAFEHNTEAIVIDPIYHTGYTFEDLVRLDVQLVFIAINAPTLDDRSVDASRIYSIFEILSAIEYKGLVVLKSTIPPVIAHDLHVKFGNSSGGNLRYIYSPEFIRERDWERDAIKQEFILLAGEYEYCKELETLYKNHSQMNGYIRFFIVGFREAALIKYLINSFLATKVTFMNQAYQLYKDVLFMDKVTPEQWQEFIDIISSDPRIGYSHMKVPGHDGEFGYGGKCFPKDVSAMIGFDEKERLSILREVEEANTKIILQSRK